MKKILLFLLLGIVPQLIHAQTAKAIWCSGNTTLYFTYDTNTYAAGGTYDGQTITNVYDNIKAEGYGYSPVPWYYNPGRQITNVVIASNFADFTPTSLKNWFYDMKNLTAITGLKNLNTSSVTDMYGLFYNCESLTSLDVSNFDTSNVVSMEAMFSGCNYLTSLDVSNFDTSNVENMRAMFSFCQRLTSLDVSRFNTSKVKRMDLMFYYCQSLTSLDVSNFDTSNVESMQSMFNTCNLLTDLDVSGFNTSKVINMSGMFSGCESLTSLDVSGFNTSNVVAMGMMFWRCLLLTSLDVSNFDTSNVTSMNGMFSYCNSLTSLDVKNWDSSKVEAMYSMFRDCVNLTSLTFGKKFSMDNITSSYNYDMFNGCVTLRYIDFFDSDDTDAITSENYSLVFRQDFPSKNKTIVIYLPHGSQTVANTRNVVYSYNGDETDLRCPEYYSEDKVDIELPRDFKTHKAIYQRTMANNYGSVILPYDFTTNDKVQAYTLDEEHTETMYFRDTQTVPAHTPFAFNVKQKGSGNVVDFTMTDSSNNFGITVNATHTTHPDEKGWDGVAGAPYSSNTNLAGWTAKGYYVNQTIEKTDPLYGDLHYIAGEKFYKAAGETLKFPPHRVTFHGTWAKGNTSGGAKSFVFAASDDEVVTAIEEAETRQTLRDAEAIYDFAGRRQHEAQKGVNIVRMKDGSVRKMFVK